MFRVIVEDYCALALCIQLAAVLPGTSKMLKFPPLEPGLRCAYPLTPPINNLLDESGRRGLSIDQSETTGVHEQYWSETCKKSSQSNLSDSPSRPTTWGSSGTPECRRLDLHNSNTSRIIPSG